MNINIKDLQWACDYSGDDFDMDESITVSSHRSEEFDLTFYIDADTLEVLEIHK